MGHRITVYPHNDLINLAYYQKEIINNKIKAGTEEALRLDCLSCIISLAFAVEALVNFVGNQKVDNWNERKKYITKVNEVCRAAQLHFNDSIEPFSTIWALKKLRDSIAHGQPKEIVTEVTTREELRAQMACPWDENLTPEFVNEAYTQVKGFKKLLLTNCEIPIGRTLTSAVGGKV